MACFAEDWAFLDKRLHETADFFDFTHKVASKIDDMRIDVAVGAGAGDLRLQAPDQWERGIRNPVLRIPRTIMINPVTQVAALDHGLGKSDGRNATVVVADHVHDARRLHGSDHLFAFMNSEAERLLTKDRLPVPRRFHSNFAMAVVRGADIDDVNFRIGDNLLPIG